jgi:hypothetical protein
MKLMTYVALTLIHQEFKKEQTKQIKEEQFRLKSKAKEQLTLFVSDLTSISLSLAATKDTTNNKQQTTNKIRSLQKGRIANAQW